MRTHREEGKRLQRERPGGSSQPLILRFTQVLATGHERTLLCGCGGQPFRLCFPSPVREMGCQQSQRKFASVPQVPSRLWPCRRAGQHVAASERSSTRRFDPLASSAHLPLPSCPPAAPMAAVPRSSLTVTRPPGWTIPMASSSTLPPSLEPGAYESQPRPAFPS